MESKVQTEVEGEPSWLEEQPSEDPTFYPRKQSEVKDNVSCADEEGEDFTPAELSRLYAEAVYHHDPEKSPSVGLDGERCFRMRGDGSGCEKTNTKSHQNKTNLALLHNTQNADDPEVNGNNHTLTSKYKRCNSVNEQKKPYTCKICEKSFSKVLQLKRHILIHEDRRLLKCRVSDNLTRPSDLKKRNLTRKSEKQHQCDVCRKSFMHISDLKKHKLIHESNIAYKCEICAKIFLRLGDYRKHCRYHESNRPHKCKVCGQGFTLLSNLKAHFMIHDGKRPYKCDTCGKTFIRMPDLRKHNGIHEGKRPHMCEVCGKSFTQSSNLKAHIMIHDGERPHKCYLCGKGFIQISNLKVHLLIHEGKRPHKCEICQKCFTRTIDLKRHSVVHRQKNVQR